MFFLSRFVFSLQATFCGSLIGKRAGYHFNTADFESMGYHLCDTLLDYCDPDDSKVRGRHLRMSPIVYRCFLTSAIVQPWYFNFTASLFPYGT